MIEVVAIVACAILFSLSIFQVLLIAGAPYGKYAWGGAHTILPKNLRISSALSVCLYILFSVTILSRAEIILESTPKWIDICMWVFTAYFSVGIIMNALSRSKSERIVMTPVAVALTVCFLYVAVS